MSSQLIAAFSAGHLSHVDCLLPDGRLLGARRDRVGGAPAGVQIRPWNYAQFTRVDVMEISSTGQQTRAFHRFLKKQIGKPYDQQSIVAFMLNRDWRQDDAWICSELQAAALEHAGVFKQALYLAANKITPVALALAASAIGGHVRS